MKIIGIILFCTALIAPLACAHSEVSNRKDKAEQRIEFSDAAGNGKKAITYVQPDKINIPKLILDADTANEFDDLYAIVRTLKQDKIEVLGLTSAQWFNPIGAFYFGETETVQASQKLNEELVKLLGREDLPTPIGSNEPMIWNYAKGSPAAEFIIKSALSMPDGEKLNVLCIGASTNLASAIKLNPEIASRIRAYVKQ